MKSFFSWSGKALRWILTTVQGIGTAALGLFVILFLVALIKSASNQQKVTVEDGALLVVRPNGILVEQVAAREPLQSLSSPFSTDTATESARDLITAISRAKDDDRIAGMAIYTDNFLGGSRVLVQEVADAIADFKTSEKPIYAISSAYSQTAYLLAVHADKIYLNTEGSVLLSGLSVTPTYYADMFEKIEATINIFRVGTYKSAIEPYSRNTMSPEVKEATQALLSELWQHYVESISKAREIPVDDINASVDQVVARLEKAKGDFATMALQNGLVDMIGPRSLWRDFLVETHGESPDSTSFKQIHHQAYLEATKPLLPADHLDEIAVITVQGTIVPGTGPDSVAASRTVISYIRDARDNPKTSAILLRIDSPGGSAFASEEIRAELASAQEDGIPVVASMGGLAASGGYWIAASADEILAAPSTITGSIGIFAIFPTFEKTAGKIGVSADGVSTSDIAGGLNPLKGINQSMKQVLQLSIEDGYRDFLTLVADNRGMTIDDVNAIGQGRVWTGAKALELGLVDKLGGFKEALEVAANLAEIDTYGVRFYRAELSDFDQFLLNLLDGANAQASTVDDIMPAAPGATLSGGRGILYDLLSTAQQIEEDLTLRDPNGRLILCMACRVH